MFTKKRFEFSDIPDLSGKVAIITGSNTGIGKVCAIEMARKNCRVIIASRSPDKGEAAVADVKNVTGNEKVEFMRLNLLSLASVKAFAEEFMYKYNELHVLLNNAGVMMCPYGLSEDGIETQFATHHVAHYYLTMLLFPLLEKSKPSRIVIVTSDLFGLTSFKAVSLDKVNDEKSYNSLFHYGLSKACNLLFTRELAKRLESKGIDNLYVNAAHPGIVRSDLLRHTFESENLIKKFVQNVVSVSTEDGALTQLYLATSPEVESKGIKGKYYVPFGKAGCPNPYSSSDKNAARLWDFTENLLKEKAPGYPGAPI